MTDEYDYFAQFAGEDEKDKGSIVIKTNDDLQEFKRIANMKWREDHDVLPPLEEIADDH